MAPLLLADALVRGGREQGDRLRRARRARAGRGPAPGDLLGGPRGLREKCEWGPSSWPMHWCEVVERKVIDCGAHAALAQEAFTARGVTAFRAQFVQRYSEDAASQWRTKWGADKVSDHWISDDVIYHEGNPPPPGAAAGRL